MQKYLANNLFKNIADICSISNKVRPKIEKLINGNQLIDLIFLRPVNINNRRFINNHLQAYNKEFITTIVKVQSHHSPIKRSAPLKVICSNEFGDLDLVFFKTFPGYIENNFAINSEIAISGKIEFNNKRAHIIHPDFVFPKNSLNKIPQIEVIYPLTYGLTLKPLRKLIFQSLSNIPNLPEWINRDLIKQMDWSSFSQSLKNMHYPKNLEDLEPSNKNIQRLAFDELLADNLANIIAKSNNSDKKGLKNNASGDLVKKITSNLSFSLTKGQEKALDEVFCDMKSDKKMLRLLQGDVGSGKTIIAFLSAILAVEDKKQAAIIVPISLLADQHFTNLLNLVNDFDINIAILTSKTKKSEKNKIIKKLQLGEIDIIIGTHALIFPDIKFKDLSLIVIDEQHRFGVMQRLDLVKKGKAPDVLLMSATPIPRSLMMTLYGDMDISLLIEKPKNRINIDTRLKSMKKIDELYAAIKRAIVNKEKIYWICPLIEESQQLDFSNILEKFELFKKEFGAEKVAMIHGKLKSKEKDDIMTNFSKKDSKIQILLATTVIEVGIDVKDATIIVIENSEKFGLSQLHQLRGRVGRSDKQSYCILLYSYALSEKGRKRLEIMKNCFDGFKVAQEDLNMRGSGQLLGTKQSGLPDYIFANLLVHQDIFQIANKNAQLILNKNPNLENEEGDNIKNLLKIFRYDNCIELIKGG